MSYFISLKKLRKLPIKRFNGAKLGINYKNKKNDVIKVNNYVNGFGKLKLKIEEIDNFNYEKDHMYNNECIIVSKRTGPFLSDISEYTDALLTSEYESAENIKLLNELWFVAYKNDNLNHPIFNDLEAWNKEALLKKYNIKYELMKVINKLYDDYHFNDQFRNLNIFATHDVVDFSAASVILTKYRNNLVDASDSTIMSVNENIEKIEHYKRVNCQIENGLSVNHIFLHFDFYNLYPYDQSLAWWLTNMHEAAKLVPEGQELIKNCESIYHPKMSSVLNHSLVEKCGHSGYTMCQTVKHLQYIYRNGWEKYVKEVYYLE